MSIPCIFYIISRQQKPTCKTSTHGHVPMSRVSAVSRCNGRIKQVVELTGVDRSRDFRGP